MSKPFTLAQLLRRKNQEIIDRWESRALDEVVSARRQTPVVFRNEIESFLEYLAKRLEFQTGGTAAQVAQEKTDAKSASRKHGADRAASVSYTLDEVIFEYHLLRQVIFRVLEERQPLGQRERDLILDAIEQAVNDFATEFSRVLQGVQDQFVNTLTHDLRNPLSSIKTNAQLILQRPGEQALCERSARRIVEATERLNFMIGTLLDAKKIRAGQGMSLGWADFELRSFVREVIEGMVRTSGKRILLDAPAEVRGTWSPDGLRRAIENLIDNAIKYGEAQAPIHVFIREKGDRVELGVHNEGPPIPEKDQSVLFEQFRRSRPAEQSASPGWGLGLTLVRGVVDAHRGTIRVVSEAGKGTTFVLDLPKKDGLQVKQRVA